MPRRLPMRVRLSAAVEKMPYGKFCKENWWSGVQLGTRGQDMAGVVC